MTTASFTPVDRARVRLAVEDYAGRYHGGPLGLGREDTIRYLVEGHLAALEGRYGTQAVWDAVAEVLLEHPEALEQQWTEAELTARQRARAARADELVAEAGRALKAGDRERALALVDEAALTAPDHCPRHRAYDWYRQRILA